MPFIARIAVFVISAALAGAAGQPVTLAVRFLPGELTVRSSPRLPPGALRRLVTRMFDLDVDLGAFHALAADLDAPRVLADLTAWMERLLSD